MCSIDIVTTEHLLEAVDTHADRVGAKRTLVVGLAIQALAVSLYVFSRDTASFYALSALFGIAYGGVMPLYAILVREYFGARA